MKPILRFLDGILSPTLIVTYASLCLILLAAYPQEGRPSLFFAMIWAAAMMAIMRWGIWGILKLATKTRVGRKELTVLVRIVEGLQVFLTLGACALAILLREIPATWLFLPAALFGLQGAIRFDVQHLH